MADMTYQQIEKAAKEKLPVLFPIAVIEEHGPHMCLGTDTYLTYSFCKKIRQRLLDTGFDCLIAPPYYWGINVATNGFAGTFTVKPETMVSILCDYGPVSTAAEHKTARVFPLAFAAGCRIIWNPCANLPGHGRLFGRRAPARAGAGAMPRASLGGRERAWNRLR